MKTVTFMILFSIQLFSQPYPQPTADIPWSGASTTVADIQAAFVNGRTVENTQLGSAISTTLIMPSQVAWDAMSASDKGLYLTNAERVARGLVPLHAVSNNVVTIAQNYADLLRTNNAFTHGFGGTTPSSRLNTDPSINGCSESGFTWGPENLYAAANSAPSTFPLALEQAVYGWIYNDAGSAWGHRNACFAPFNDNFGTAGNEGFVGFGVSVGAYTFFGPSFPFGVVVVYNFVDPCPDSPLPVELTAFIANLNGSNVELKWQTATEVNNYGFEIQRLEVSNQPAEFEKVGFVVGFGNSNNAKEYSFTDVPKGGLKFQYRLKQIDSDGNYEYSKIVEVSIEAPSKFVLHQNYPNPFNPTTRIDYQLPFDSKVTLELYRITGEKVATILNGELAAGYYTADINANTLNLTSGVYFYKISAVSGNNQAFTQVKKLMLMK